MRKIILHPFLFAVYPVIALFAFNMGQSRVTDVLRAFLVLPLIAGILLFILGRILKDNARAGLLVTLTFLLFFSSGHLVNRLASTRFGPFLEKTPVVDRGRLFDHFYIGHPDSHY